ncbi:carbon-nitrogen hydrolase family protein [Diaphorobacter sp. HDW4A]|uniref:carbon-nitrogen hydrolase family protein n=1 Tax=Diaphorobacter sp. HDW4A TaxID=2714924 RepID=UPI0014091159|nr:carbon-nitrogen hydrolase family protein [Diaphorobacter sp. HDW4A]QIL83005.1 carbon-nitrogen hydrolase family protein [Diaphorobacter sp. HDW4A]
MKIAAIQMVSGTGLEANLATARRLLEEAAARGAELACLPEYFCVMGHKDTDKFKLREEFGRGAIQQFLSDAARELGLWIVGGTLPLRAPSEEHVYNTTLVFAPDGACVTRYDKIHLFRFDSGSEHYDEARVISPGTQPIRFTITARDGSAWRVGLSVCYDLRFPELYRAHARAGVDLLLVPSAFTFVTGSAHWDVLLRARAVENLAYVLAPAQGGVHENGRRTWGHSMLVDPWGTVLAQRAQGEGVVIGMLEHRQLREMRAQLPALDHRVL